MALNLYCGLMGSGKTYEVVSGPICDAIASGRRVVTNIAGINELKIHDYLCKKNPALDRASFGTVIHVPDRRVTEPAFFPIEDKPEAESVVKGGDLVAIDEAWRFWDTKLPPEHEAFFRMHRHFVHPTSGVTCDVVLMTQDSLSLTRGLRSIVEVTFRMHKLKAIGKPTSYRVEMYEGSKQTNRARVGTFMRKYDPKIFPLYKSYEGDGAKEVQVDKRQNVLFSRLVPRLLFVLALVGFPAYYVRGFFKSPGADVAEASKSQDSSKAKHASPDESTRPTLTRTEQDFSTEWRIAGEFESNGERYIIVADPQGRLRAESPSVFRGEGIARVGKVDGARVTPWTGNKPSSHLGFSSGDRK